MNSEPLEEAVLHALTLRNFVAKIVHEGKRTGIAYTKDFGQTS